MSPRKPLDATTIEGRTLLALRAGPMSSSELAERFGKIPPMANLQRKGMVGGDLNGWFLTPTGRAACPLRNPAAATVVPVPTTSKPTPTRVAAVGVVPEPIRRPAPAPKGIEMPQTDKHRSAVDQIRALLHATPKGMSRKDLIKRSGLADYAVDNAIMKLIKAGEAERTGYGVIAATAKIKPAAILVTPLVTPCAAMPTPEKVRTPIGEPIPATKKISFSLDDEGYLTIVHDDEITLLPPNATRRLGIFLGCLDEAAWPPRLAGRQNAPAHPIQPAN